MPMPLSSAAASVGWPPRYGLARAAIASRCSSGSTLRAAAPTCSGRTATPSMPARRSSPRHSCSRSSGRWPAAASPMTSNCARSTRFTASASTTARLSTARPIREAMRARDRAVLARTTSPATTRFMRASEAVYKVGFEQLGHVPFDSWLDMARILPKMVRLGSQRSVHGMVARYLPERAPALRVQLPPAVRRRQPIQRHVDLRADRLSGAPLRRALRDGRHRPSGRRARAPDRRPGRLGAHERRGHGHHASARPRDRRAACERRADQGRRRGLQRRSGLDVRTPAARPCRAAAGPTASSSARTTR